MWRRWKEGEKDQRVGVSRLNAAAGLVHVVLEGRVTVRQREERSTYSRCVKHTQILYAPLWAPLPALVSALWHETPPSWSLWKLGAHLRVCQTVKRWRFLLLLVLHDNAYLQWRVKQNGGLPVVLLGVIIVSWHVSVPVSFRCCSKAGVETLRWQGPARLTRMSCEGLRVFFLYLCACIMFGTGITDTDFTSSHIQTVFMFPAVKQTLLTSGFLATLRKCCRW